MTMHKLLKKSFHLNGHTLGFDPQTQMTLRLNHLVQHNKHHHRI